MKTFELFSSEHLMTLAGNFIIMIVFLLISSRVRDKKKFAKISAVLIALLKILEISYRIVILEEPLRYLLPLHLCNLTLIVAIITMALKSYFFFELLYFWSIGTIFALLTPEVRESFPHFLNISFFTTHFYLIFSTIYCIKFFKFRPNFKSLKKSIIYLNVIFIIVFMLNFKLKTNYMYVNYKPVFRSPLDYMGPWPYYIIWIEVIAMICFLVMYLPFSKKKW